MAHIFKGSSDLLWQPDTQVQSFASGLIQVTRTAICRTSLKARLMPKRGEVLPCDSRAIDKVLIYPDPIPTDGDGGFTGITVVGYGRTTTSKATSKYSGVVTVTRNNSDVAVVAPFYRVQYVKKSTETSTPQKPSGTYRGYVTTSGERFTFASSYMRLQAYEEADYGAFVEVTEVWGIQV